MKSSGLQGFNQRDLTVAVESLAVVIKGAPPPKVGCSTEPFVELRFYPADIGPSRGAICVSSVSGVCRLPVPKIMQQLKRHFSLVLSVVGVGSLSSCSVFGARKRRERFKSNPNRLLVMILIWQS